MIVTKHPNGKNCPKCNAPVEHSENTYNGEVYLRMTHCSKCSWVFDPSNLPEKTDALRSMYKESMNEKTAHCTKCEDEVLGDEDGMCGNCAYGYSGV